MFICSKCNATSLKWSGKCNSCGEWNTLEEKQEIVVKKWKISTWSAKTTEKLIKSEILETKRYSSSSVELDGVLGWGLVPGSLILLSGEPGIGKSTLSLQMSEWYSSRGFGVLYVSGEENIMQISGRARRLGIESENIDLLSESDFESIVATIETSPAKIIIIDSLSVLSASSLEGTPGSISQIRAMTEMCMQLAKKLSKSIILIGHVTKDGSIGGPKTLEHLVDVVLFLEGLRTENYRILRAFKNRFGATDSVGLFRMDSDWLKDLSNPGMEFIDENNFSLSGSALTMTIEWNRPILVEVEALTTYTKFGYPKRSARGINSGKLDLLVAVMMKFADLKLDSSDVYLNVARGINLMEPGTDLACIMAIISSKNNISLWKTLFLGEVSLTGVIKHIFLWEKRLFEAAKLGFTKAVISDRYDGKIPENMEVIRIKNISELVKIFKK